MSIVPSAVGAEQLAALGRLHQEFTASGPVLVVWGLGRRLHVGRVTRRHDDIDLAVRTADSDRVDTLLLQLGWDVAGDAAGYRTYRSGNVQLDVAWVDDDDDRAWPAHAFGSDMREGRRLLTPGSSAEPQCSADKSAAFGDPAKDAHDVAALQEVEETDPAYRRPRSPVRMAALVVPCRRWQGPLIWSDPPNA